MKRTTITFVLILCFFASFAQVRKSTAVKKPTELEAVRFKAKSWFKAFYVPLNFKDPYSYELLKLSCYPVTYEERIKEMLSDANYVISREDTTQSFSDYQVKKSEYLRTKNYHDVMFRGKSSVDSTTYKGSLSFVEDKWKAVEDILFKYKKASKDKADLEKSLVELPDEQLKKTMYYALYLDCYAKNSYGNKVLGRYVFEFTRDGQPRGDVRQINE